MHSVDNELPPKEFYKSWSQGGYVMVLLPKKESHPTISLVYTRVLTRIQPRFASSANAPNQDCNPG